MLHQFEKWQQIWILICLIKGCHATDSIQRKFKLVKGPNGCQGKVPMDGFLEETAVSSKIDCAKSCSANENCTSMYYLSSSKACKIHGKKITEIPRDQLIPNPEVMYYLSDRNDEVTCPNDTSVFQPAQTSDGTQFQFRIFLDISRSFDVAQAHCESHGAKLYKVLTPEKMEFALNLMTCQAYVSCTISYWVNAKSDSGRIDDWQTTDGEPMPMNSTFWAPERPEVKTQSRCARLYYGYNYKLDDTWCSAGNSSPRYAFCEK